MVKQQTIGIAVAGCGRIGREVFLSALGSMPAARIAALADPDTAARAQAARMAPGAATSPDWRAIVDRPDVDAVVVALPTPLHADAAVAVIEAGKALYLEKPLATSAADGRRVLAAWRSKPSIVMIGFNYRFNPLLAALKARVDTGAVGRPLLVRTVFSTRWAPGDSWRAPTRPGGGVLFDLASHHVDLVHYVLDDPVRVVAAKVNGFAQGAEVVSLQLETRGGVMVDCCFATGTVDDDRFEVTGDEGQVKVDRYQSTAVGFRPPGVPGALARVGGASRSARALPHVWRKMRSPWNEPSYALALERFLDAVARQTPVTPDPSDGWRTLAVVLAAREAALQGRRLEVDAAADAEVIRNGH
jgi:myo-inositol 2-dehydrogenase/D-chiro-inositol 1-dehydrogenase